MKRKLLILSILTLTLCLLLASCGNKAMEKLTIDEGMKYTYTLGETPDFSTVKATATYNDGSTVALTGADLTFGTLDTSTVGTKKLTITYDGFTLTIDVKVEGISIDPGDGDNNVSETGYEILGVDLPDSLAAFETNGQRFKDTTAVYVVGNDNPFTFRLVLHVLDQNDQPLNYMQKYISTSTVHLIEGNTETLVGTDYVTVDENNNTFKFTDLALGKTFKLTTRPLNGVEGIETTCTRSFVVKVVDGYNVTNAKELHLMTNHYDSMLHDGYTYQTIAASLFIDANFGANYYATYGGDNLKGLIFHNDINLTPDDMPAGYIVQNTDEEWGFVHHFSIFYRLLNLTAPTFSMYGNYFTLNTSALPSVCLPGDNNESSSEIFNIKADHRPYDQENLPNFDQELYNTHIENLAMRNADPNEDENDPAVIEKRLHALAAIKFTHQQMEIYNSIIEAYMISIVAENQNTDLSLNKVIFNNAWQGHVFAWITNMLQDNYGDKNAAPMANHTPIRITITDSVLTKCGGPVILGMHDTSKNPCDANNAIEVVVDEASELWSYVTGGEAWFQAYGKVELATSLIALDQPLSATAAGFAGAGIGQASSMLTTRPNTGETKFVNFIFACVDANATFTVNNQKLYDTKNDATVQMHFTAGAGQLGAPLFQSSNGGYGIYAGTPQNPNVPITSVTNQQFNAYAEGPAEAAKLFSGNYLGIHVSGMFVLTGYNH